jgi:hypothetical protein|tara:strand:+ start:959 stop:2341 length:1383 start_codon:yes stop_codon:yes gene_type:complete
MTTLTAREENIAGSDLSGSNGATSRTYTLANSNVHASGVEIHVDGSFLHSANDFSRSGTTVTFNIAVFNSATITINYFTETASASASSTTYATTTELARFMGIDRYVPDRDLEGESRVREEVGTGDNSETRFFLDKARVLADTYTLEYGASESGSLTTLTETTHYTLDKEEGKITLTASGVSAVATNKIFASYGYVIKDVGITDVQLADAIARSEKQVDSWTNNHFVDSSVATPDWNQQLNEKQDGKGVFDRNYFTLQNYPIPDVSTALNGAVAADDATITVDSTNGFPSSGSVLIDGDKIDYTGKSTTTFTGCTSVSAHSDGDAVKAYVIEISTTSPGGTISWDVLTENTEFEINKSTGRIHLYADGTNYEGTYVDIESSPINRVANRFRVSYLSGYSSIPEEIVKSTLMLASKDLMSMTVRKSHTSGLNNFSPTLLNVDEEELKKTLSTYRNEQFTKI